MSRDAWSLLMLVFGSISIVGNGHAQSASVSAPWAFGADVRASAQPLPVVATGLFVSREFASIGARSALEVELGALSRSKSGPGYACPAVPGAVCNDERTVSAIGDVLVRARATMGNQALRPSFSVAIGAYATRLDGYSTGPVSGSPAGALVALGAGIRAPKRGLTLEVAAYEYLNFMGRAQQPSLGARAGYRW